MGKGRGGTSLVAGILHRLGVNMGNELKEHEVNPTGTYEDIEILHLTQHILRKASCAGTLDNLDTEKSEKKILALKNNYDRLIRKIVERNNEKSKLWGWKDERSCFVIKLFLPYLIKPHFVVVHRNMYSIARSLERVDKLGINDGLLSSMSSYKKIFEFLNGTDYPVLHVSYESFFTKEKTDVIKKICTFCGIDKSKIKNIDDFIDKKLQHFV